jgi:hypothetical protein
MSACNFNIPFSGSASDIIGKARSAVSSQGGNFQGDDTSGQFDVSIFGNKIKGSYKISGQTLDLTIDDKPFLVPCSTIESFLKNQLK